MSVHACVVRRQAQEKQITLSSEPCRASITPARAGV